jgi:hypothetical protein
MSARGMLGWLVTHLIEIATLGSKGAFSTESSGPIVQIVKRPPLTTRQFVEDHKAIFA